MIINAKTANTTLATSCTDVTATAAEVNVLDGIPATLTATELGYVDGVTSAIQTQLNSKVNIPALTRPGTVASSATPTPDADSHDVYTVTALAEAATFGAPTGTPTNGQRLIIRVKDNATARVLAWNAIYRAGTDVALPLTTVISKTVYCGFIYNSTDTKWDLVTVVGNI